MGDIDVTACKGVAAPMQRGVLRYDLKRNVLPGAIGGADCGILYHPEALCSGRDVELAFRGDVGDRLIDHIAAAVSRVV